MVSLKREFGHQFGPAVHVVGVVRRFHVFFAQVDFLSRVRLHIVWVNAAGGGEHDFLDSRPHGLPENESVQEKVRGRAGLMQIHVAAPPMISGKVEDNCNAIHGLASDARLAQVRFNKLDPAIRNMLLDIAQPPAREIVHYTHTGSAFDERIHQVRPDE